MALPRPLSQPPLLLSLSDVATTLRLKVLVVDGSTPAQELPTNQISYSVLLADCPPSTSSHYLTMWPSSASRWHPLTLLPYWSTYPRGLITKKTCYAALIHLKPSSFSLRVRINNNVVYFSKTPRDMLGCMIRRYNDIAQPTEQHSLKMESEKGWFAITHGQQQVTMSGPAFKCTKFGWRLAANSKMQLKPPNSTNSWNAHER